MVGDTDDDIDDDKKENVLLKDIKLSQEKIATFEHDTFIWNIRDKHTLSKLSNFEYNASVISDIFELFKDKYKFIINLRLLQYEGRCGGGNTTQQNQLLNLGMARAPPQVGYVRVDIGSVNGNGKGIICKVNINILELNIALLCQYFAHVITVSFNNRILVIIND